jgi:hypothetical protein
MLSRDQRRVVRHKTRLLNQLTTTLKEYYARPLEVFEDLETEIALDFLKLSLRERDRRYSSITERLREEGVDCAIVSGSNLFCLNNGIPASYRNHGERKVEMLVVV